MIFWKLGLFALLLVAALYVIVFRPTDRRARDWAFGVAGAILGYLLAP